VSPVSVDADPREPSRVLEDPGSTSYDCGKLQFVRCVDTSMTRAFVLLLVLGCEEPRTSSETTSASESPTTSATTATTATAADWRLAFEVRDEGEVRVLSDVIALGTRGLSLGGEAVTLPEGALTRRGDGAWLVATPDGLAMAPNDRPNDRPNDPPNDRPNDVRAASASVVRGRFADVDGRSLLLTIEERIDGGRVTSLVLRDGATLAELASFLIASNAEGRGHADVRLEGRELVVAVPEDCAEGSCRPTRLERWSLEDPLQRRVIAQAFDDVSFDESGRFALVRTEAHRSVRVIDTRDGTTRWTVSEYAPRGESCGDDPGSMAWPEVMALSPDGERVALVERGEALRLRIVRAAPQEESDGSAGARSAGSMGSAGSAGSVTELDRAVDALPELAFADGETLVVRGATLEVFRR